MKNFCNKGFQWSFIIITISWSFFLCNIASSENSPSPESEDPLAYGIQLDDREKAWLKIHKKVRIGTSQYPPLTFMDDSGFIVGISADYLKQISERTGLKFEAKYYAWPDLMKQSKSRGVDLFSGLKNPEREKYLNFTSPYLQVSYVVVNRLRTPFFNDFSNLNGQKVAVVKNWTVHKLMGKKFPKIKILPFDSVPEALTAVSTRRAQAYVGDLLTASYQIQKNVLINLKIAASAPFRNDSVRFAVRNDWPELTTILDKTIQSLSREEHESILQKWLQLRFEKGVDWSLVWRWSGGISGFFCLIIIVIIYRDRRLLMKNEKKLRNSITDLRESVKAGHVGLWNWNLITNEIIYSAEWKRQIGYKEHEIGNDFSEWENRIHPDDLKPTIKIIEKSIKDVNQDHRTEFRFRHKDGSYRWIFAQASFLQNEKGHPINMVGSHLDITDRKKAEKDLNESEARFRSVAETAVDAIISIDHSGKIIFWNDAAKNHFDYSSGEIIGKSVSLIIPEKFKQDHSDGMKRLLASGRSKSIGKTIEVVGLKKGGTEFPIELSLAMWKTREDLYFTAIIRDISQRKMVENILKENEEKYRSLFENSPMAIVHLDKSGVITACNQNLCEILGSTLEKLIGLDSLKFLKDEMMLDAIFKALSGHKSYYDGEYLSVTGEIRTSIRAIFAPIFSEDGGLTGAIGIFEDITEQLSAEQEKIGLESQLRQLQKVEALGALAGGIAHDFNNILFPILAYSEMLADDFPKGSPHLESINEILIGAKRAKGLVDQILTFSRQTDHKVSPLNPGLVIKEVIKLIRSTIPSTIKIEQYIDPECLMILADPTHIHQVAMNLVTNAYHAMRNSGGTLTIQLQNSENINQIDEKFKESEKDFVWLSVSDTGGGMDSITLEKIFDPYFTTKPKGEGTGLGLSVIHGIIKNYNGQIIVNSTPGVGSTFDVYIPALQQKTISESKIEDFINTQGNENILLVDDEHQILRVEKMMLERLGYKVETQSKSLRAFELVKDDPDRFDLIVTDMTMPDMTGDVLARKVMDIIPNFPVIVCTGFSDRISPEKAASIGIRGLLYKPIIKSDFARMVRFVLDERAQ